MKARNPKTIQDQIDQAACGTSRKLYRINGAEFLLQVTPKGRSEERRVGKECRL